MMHLLSLRQMYRLKVEEQDAIEQYVNDGGSVFFIADHYNADRNKNRWDAAEVFNGYRRGAYDDPAKGMDNGEKNSEAMQNVESSDWLAETFGVRFRYNAVGDVNATEIVPATESFGITEGVESVAMHAGATVAILDPEVAKGIVYLPEGLDSSDKWGSAVDQGVYEGGGVDEGAYVAIAKKGAGKAAFIGDFLLGKMQPRSIRMERQEIKPLTMDIKSRMMPHYYYN